MRRAKQGGCRLSRALNASHARRLRRAHARAAEHFSSADFLHRESHARLLDRLQWINLPVSLLADLGAGQLAGADTLRERFTGARLIAIDHALPMLLAAPAASLRVVAEADQLPLPDASVDLAFSNLLLPYLRDPTPVLAETRRALRQPGLFAFSTLGPDSFAELRQAWAGVDDYTHFPPFPDMPTLGGLLGNAGFAEPVLDVDKLTVSYTDFDRLFNDLAAVGSANHSTGRNPGLTGRGVLTRLRQALDLMRDRDGQITVGIQLIFGLAWSAELQRGDVAIPLTDIGRR